MIVDSRWSIANASAIDCRLSTAFSSHVPLITLHASSFTPPALCSLVIGHSPAPADNPTSRKIGPAASRSPPAWFLDAAFRETATPGLETPPACLEIAPPFPQTAPPFSSPASADFRSSPVSAPARAAVHSPAGWEQLGAATVRARNAYRGRTADPIKPLARQENARMATDTGTDLRKGLPQAVEVLSPTRSTRERQ